MKNILFVADLMNKHTIVADFMNNIVFVADLMNKHTIVADLMD